MAAIDKTDVGVTTFATVAGKLVGAGFFTVEGSGQAFTGIYCESETSAGVVTTSYLWPSTTGVWQKGTTQPTIATQDSAGAAIGAAD